MRIAVRGIRKQFGSTAPPALDDVDFSAESGSVVALLGENGAGKSTLVNVLAGRIAADSGTIEIDGKPVRIRSPRDATALGIGMVPQHDAVIDELTVAENLELARSPATAFVSRATLALRQRDAQRTTGFTLPDPERRGDSLGLGERQKIELVRALSAGARVLVLDEPTAVLAPDEADRLLAEIARLAHAGLTVIYITHRLAEVEAIADAVTVLRHGRVAARFDTRPFPAAELVRAMVGAEPVAPTQEVPTPMMLVSPGAQRISVEGLTAGRLRGMTTAVRGGEIVMVAGVDGNGQRELFECIAGLRAPESGRVLIGGHPLVPASPARARELGLALVPEDRGGAGLAPSLSIAENLHLSIRATRELTAAARGPFAWRTTLLARAARAAGRFGVRGAALGDEVRMLSGGNQQRVILARELSVGVDSILLHNPTRGLDLRATAFVHAELLESRRAGAAVLWITSDVDEALALADRLLVLTAGRIVAELPSGADRAAVGRALAGAAP